MPLFPSLREPNFDISDNMSPGIEDLKQGQSIQAIIHYKVVDKTEDTIELQITYFFILSTRRKDIKEKPKRSLDVSSDSFIPKIEPTFKVSDNMSPNIDGLKEGQTVQAIINFKTINKTKSFAVLRITNIHLLPMRRKF